jgi:predicted metal-dependent hydrolase
MKITHKNLHINVLFSKRKSIGLYVKSAGIEVRAPTNTPIKFIHSFIEEKSDWLLRTYELQIQKSHERIKLINKEEVPILGVTKHLSIRQAKRRHITETKDSLILALPTPNQPSVNKAFSQHLISLAKAYIPPIAEQVHQELNIQKEIKDIRFKRTKTKWGHCTSDGRMQFNWLIMMAPPEIIRHVVVHEVCHLEHMNHSKDFWSLVYQSDKEHTAHRQWLNAHSHTLPDLSS